MFDLASKELAELTDENERLRAALKDAGFGVWPRGAYAFYFSLRVRVPGHLQTGPCTAGDRRT